MNSTRRPAVEWLAALAVALLGLLAFGTGHWALAAAPSQRGLAPAIEVSPPQLDFGAIQPQRVSHSFTVTNRGGSNLEIQGVSTSCGCTTATISKTTLATGESAALTVTYDPALHGNSPGDFTRVVYVRSNDPRQPEVQVQIKVTVLPSETATVSPKRACEHCEGDPIGGEDKSAALSTALPTAAPPQALADDKPDVDVYYSKACGECGEYIGKTLAPMARRLGWPEISLKDYIDEPAYRAEMRERSDRLGVPASLQGHITTFVGDRIVLEGHVPEQIVSDLLAAPSTAFERMLVFQDRMDDQAPYKVWAFAGEVKEYQAGTPISQYLEWWGREGRATSSGSATPSPSTGSLLPMVLTSGFLDGLNPCAFAVLLFFVAFLATLGAGRVGILRMGLVYVAAIYAAYFLIGLGLLRALVIANQPHLMARIGAYLVIVVGLINIKDWLFPGSPVSLRIPTIAHATIQAWLKRATVPAAAIGGFLVGLCTFPCSGGIYVAVLGLLGSRATYAQGLGYLALYNLMFVLPLIVVLALAVNRRLLHQLRLVEQEQSGRLRLIGGLAMVATGIAILIWFV